MGRRKSLPFDQFPRKFQRSIKRLETPRRGRRGYSEASVKTTIQGFGQYLAAVQNAGLPLEISLEGLGVFIDNLDARQLRNSTRLTYLTAVQAIAKETGYPVSERRLILEDCEIYREAMKAEVPMKVRKLALRPLTLKDIALAAVKWRKKAQENPNKNKKHTYYRRSAYLALLSLMPLRVKDLNDLEVGVHMLRQEKGWVLRFASSKTGFRHNGELHHSLTPYLDDLLLYGETRSYHAQYAARHGTPLFANDMNEALSLRTMAASFKAATGHSPHIVRTLVHDAMAEHGTYGGEIARVLCGQSSVQIAKVYEIHAARFRAQKAQEVLSGIQNQMLRAPKQTRLSNNILRARPR